MARVEDFYFKAPDRRQTKLTITDERVTLKVDQRHDFATMAEFAWRIAEQVPYGGSSLRGTLNEHGTTVLYAGRNTRREMYRFEGGELVGKSYDPKRV